MTEKSGLVHDGNMYVPASLMIDQTSKRRKLRNLNGRWHCPVVGTCLKISDLTRLAKKLKLDFGKGAHDYRFHVHFVGAIGKHGPTAKLVQKLLDRRYRLTINRFSHADTPEALLAHWNEARSTGNIPGPFWAIITHPQANEEVGSKIYADVHMLSHLVGASNRADIGRLSDLEKQNTDLEDTILKIRHRFRGALEESKAVAVEMEKRLADTDNTLSQLKALVRETNSEGDAEDLKRRLADQDRNTKNALRQNEQLKTDLNTQKGKVKSLRDFNDTLQDQCDELRAQCAALEDQLSALLVPSPSCDNSACPVADEEEDLNLCRKCVAFVGGRSRQAPHFRALVEKSDGIFLHHDGGLDESQLKLEAVLAKADMVFFPVDCISHGASTKIKRHCKRFNKPFVPLPTSGLSTFVTGLRDVTRQESTPLTDARSGLLQRAAANPGRSTTRVDVQQ